MGFFKNIKYLSLRNAILLVAVTSTICSMAEIPTGYYQLADGKKKAELKTALSSIISQASMYSYGGGKESYTWAGFYITDRDTTDNSVIDRYSNEVRYFTDSISSVSGMHIEHSLPKSWWGSIVNNAYCDLHHLFPADGSANSTKNNLPLGTTSSPTFNNGVSKVGPNDYSSDYTGRCFEPADEYKGDFARAYMYISTAYESFASLWNSPMMDNNTYPVWKKWAISLLLEWHNADPVSDEERDRMEKVYSIQGNRNPFIDYPQLASYIWGADTLNEYHFPIETEPYLIYPNRWTTADFGVVLKNAQQTISIPLLGVNFSSNLQFSIKNETSSFQLSNTTITPTAAMAGTQIGITFLSSEVGNIADTLIITGGGLSNNIYIPLNVVVTSEFLALKSTNVRVSSADLNWMKEPSSDNYLIDLYQGNTAAGDLFFSAYVEGSSWNKALEIYNGTGKSIDLSKYSIRKQSNGKGEFADDAQLSGTLAAGETYLIVHYSAGDDLKNQANRIIYSAENYSNTLSFSGDDAMALYREGVLVDVIGYVDQTTAWGTDITLKRKSTVQTPNAIFDMNEWDSFEKDDFSPLGTHHVDYDMEENYILQHYPVGNVTSYHVINLSPSSRYSYRVYACNTATSSQLVSSNTKQIETQPLSAPLALEATEITNTSFVANWEDDADVEGFLLNVFQLSGTGEITEMEQFSSVGSTGIPLPEGWSGTIKGIYDTAANSGNSTPSIAFKNDGEQLQTKTYPQPITSITFMQKYISGGAGSSLLIETYSNGTWQSLDNLAWVNNTKSYPSYTFQSSDNVTAIRFTYNKTKGNLAFDDFTVTYGQYDTTYIVRNQEVHFDSYLLTNLENNTTYIYTLQSYIAATISPLSESVEVTTTDCAQGISIPTAAPATFSLYSIGNKIIIENADAPVSIYTLSGRMLLCSPPRQHIEWNSSASGIYIICIGGYSFKIATKTSK